MLINYAHSDWLGQRFIHINIVERNIMMPYSDKGLKNNHVATFRSRF